VGVRSLGIILGTNITTAVIEFDPNDAPGGSGSVHAVNINVNDANGFSFDFDVFTITIEGNSPPQWDINTVVDHILIEDQEFYLNLSENVSDLDGDVITFSYSSNNDFPSFSIGAGTGIINVSPIDEDVGEHIVTISAADPATPTPLVFNFTVLNVNDNPLIETPIPQSLVINAIVDADSNINASEDNLTSISFFVQDDDFLIPQSQKNYYDEALSVDLSLTGANENLFVFVQDPSFPAPGNENRALFTATFTPNKTDLGVYNVSINITDLNMIQSVLGFNLTVIETEHPPVLMPLEDQFAIVNGALYYDINATDAEDGTDEGGLLRFSYEFLNSTGARTDDFINNNENIFNSTSGVLNASFDVTQGGAYHLNITVNDSSGMEDYGDFWIFVYGEMIIFLPSPGFVFDLVEGQEDNLTFLANSSALANLTYEFYLNEELRFNTSYYGNGSEIVWQFIPDYTDETYGLYENLTLLVLVPMNEFLNVSMTWNVNITHSNAPIGFTDDIGDKQATVGQTIEINLTDHFIDVDYFDKNYNQTLNFTLESNTNESKLSFNIAEFSNFNDTNDSVLTMFLTASSPTVEIANITGNDLNGTEDVLTSAISNNFVVEFTEPETVTQPTSGGGGGGGGGRSRKKEVPIVLKLIFPDPVSAQIGETVILPIELINEGTSVLHNIDLFALIAKNGIIRNDINIYFDKPFIESIPIGSSAHSGFSANSSSVKIILS